LIDIDVLGTKDKEQATIDIDVLTHERRSKLSARQHPKHLLDSQGLLGITVGGKKDEEQDLIDIDVATHDRRDGGDKGLLDVDVGGYKDEQQSTIDIDILTKNRPSKDQPTPGGNSGNLDHYEPICKKAIKDRASAVRVKAKDVNHCLSLCSATAARATIAANPGAISAANIKVCAAIDFNSSAVDGNNCAFLVRGKDESFADTELVDNDKHVVFIRK
jgi:hypothetical protein